MSKEAQAAKNRYRLLIVPAGKNDRMVKIMDLEGKMLKSIYARHPLGGSREDYLDVQVERDLASLDAANFAQKYGLPEAAS